MKRQFVTIVLPALLLFGSACGSERALEPLTPAPPVRQPPVPKPPVPEPVLTSLEVTPSILDLDPGGSWQLSIVARDQRGVGINLGDSVACASNDPAVAEVGPKGFVRAVASGTAEITVRVTSRGASRVATVKVVVRHVRVDDLATATVITADPAHGWPASVTHIPVGGTVTWIAGLVDWAGVPQETIWIMDKNYQTLERLPLRDGRATKKFETRGTFPYCSGGCWDPPDFGVVQVH